MKKFAGMAYDATDLVTEGNINYLASLVKNDPDELEKNAHIPSRDETEVLPSEEFALVLYHPQTGFLNKYATGDKYITKLNLKIFEDKHRGYPDEIAKTAAYYLVRAARHYRLDVPEEVEKLASGKHVSNVVDLTLVNKTAWINKQEMDKVAEEVEYALPEKKKYPIHTIGMVKKAMDYFEQHSRKFEPKDALEFASHVKQAAVKFNLPTTGTTLDKYASLTSQKFNEDLKAHLLSRKGYVSEDNAGVYDELLEKSASLGVVKTAEYLAVIDKKFEVNRQWNRGVHDPYLSVLGMVKEANCSHKGKTIKKSMLKKAAESIVDADTLKDLSGPDGLDVFESLPRPIKDKIANNI
jgi:hypothetical protein